MTDTTDPNNYFFGYIGVASALVFANLGAAYGSAKAGVGICSMGVLKPDLIMKSVVPVVMAGILGIYGMIVAVIIVQKSTFILIQFLPRIINLMLPMLIQLQDFAAVLVPLQLVWQSESQETQVFEPMPNRTKFSWV